ncbi:hypothetical protein KP509_01G053300 [Ceratopteris richardii]|uniref:DCD domain-containing protein n=1 Tax=Ceratopteris richardii TaxID=49495 RepID=A0A8T2VKS5_CERRI|nr:hypothetical protein KP509_01G053300 [Ceratopteris richardii]
MPSHQKADLTTSSLLDDLNEELERHKRQKADKSPLPKPQGSVRCRLGNRVGDLGVQDGRGCEQRELYGVIFMCNRRTWKECLGQCLFGLPSGKKTLVEKVVPGMKLFLFEYERRQLWGVFKAASHGTMDIIPNAYSGGSFPCQVRVDVPEYYVALNEDEFYDVLKDNYFSDNKFHFDLDREQYLKSRGLEPECIQYQSNEYLLEKCVSMGQLLISNEEALEYYKVLRNKPLTPELCTCKQWIAQGEICLHSQEEVEFGYRRVEKVVKRIERPASGSNCSVPCLDMDIQHKWHIEGDVSGFTKGGDDKGGSMPLYSMVNTHRSVENVNPSEHLPQNHSNRANGKSVWDRISGRAKPPVASQLAQRNVDFCADPSESLTMEVISDSKVIEVETDSVEDDFKCGIVIEDVKEEYSIGFKRRRPKEMGVSGSTALVQTRIKSVDFQSEVGGTKLSHEAQTNKRRRKLIRPFFEDPNGRPLVDQLTTTSESASLFCTNSGDASQTGTLKLSLEEGYDLKTMKDNEDRVNSSLHNGNSFVNSGSSGNVSMRAVSTSNLPAKLDLNIPWESPVEDFVSSGLENTYNHGISLDSELKQDVDSKSPLHNKETDSCLDCSGKGAKSSDNMQNDVPVYPVPLSTQMDKLFEEYAGSGGASELFDTDSNCLSLQLMPRSSSRVNVHSLNSCSSTKEAVCNSSPMMEQMNVSVGLAAPSQAAVKDMPLQLGVSCGAKVSEVDIQLTDNNKVPKHLSDNPSNMLDIKSLLNGLQVSGVELQLGTSPCLILKLDNSCPDVNNRS